MKYAIVTFGCRVNQADSFQLEEQLIGAGGTASSAQDADLVVVNTCSVTGSADQGARQIVRKIARENPRAPESSSPAAMRPGGPTKSPPFLVLCR